mgnify:CR=1 FL=1
MSARCNVLDTTVLKQLEKFPGLQSYLRRAIKDGKYTIKICGPESLTDEPVVHCYLTGRSSRKRIEIPLDFSKLRIVEQEG